MQRNPYTPLKLASRLLIVASHFALSPLMLLILLMFVHFFFPQRLTQLKISNLKRKIAELLLLCLQAVAFRGGHSQSSVCILPCSPQTNFSPSINLLFALLPATIKLGIPPPFHSLSFICTSSNHLSLASLPLSSIKTSRALALMYSSRLVYHHHVQIEPQLFNLCCLNHLHPPSPNLSAN